MKPAYNLRSRVVTLSSSDGTPVRACRLGEISDDSSFLRNEDGIVDEEIPDHMIEQCNEALTDEVRKLQVKSDAIAPGPIS